MIYDMDSLTIGPASPKLQSVRGRARLEFVNPYWVYEFGVLCQTPGFRPTDLQKLIPGLAYHNVKRGIFDVAVRREHVEANMASITPRDVVLMMKLGAFPSYAVVLVRERLAMGYKLADLVAEWGVPEKHLKKAIRTERSLFVDPAAAVLARRAAKVQR